MPHALIAHDDLYAALQPLRVAPQPFEAGVRLRLQAAHPTRAALTVPLPQSPWLRAAASLLPLPLATQSTSANAIHPSLLAATTYKLFAMLAFPAITFFLLLGAAFVGASRIRNLDFQSGASHGNEASLHLAVKDWWRKHRWSGILIYALTLGLALLGATWAMFAIYIASLAVLLLVLPSFAQSGLGTRQVIGPSCVMALALLGQIALIPPLGPASLHLVDPALSAAILWVGVLLLLPLVSTRAVHVAWRIEPTPRWLYIIIPIQLLGALVVWLTARNLWLTTLLAATALFLWAMMAYRARRAGQRTSLGQMHVAVGLLVLVIVGLLGWLLAPIYLPATPQRIKRYAESFQAAPHGAVSWSRWEIVARWTQEQGLAPDLSGARRLLDRELAGQQDPFILGSAFRLGLFDPNQLSRLHSLESQRQLLLDGPQDLLATQQIPSVEQADWVIRAMLLADTLSPADRDLLASRLNCNLDALPGLSFDALHTALLVTQLLQAIDRPVDVARYRPLIHELLISLHTTRGGGFELPGGFQQFPGSIVPSLTATSDAVRLMHVYGIPAGLNLDWIRSYLRPQHLRLGDQPWIAAVTRDRFNALPGITSPPWYKVLYYERALIAAAILVGLCLYATARAPVARLQMDQGISPA